ncbi:hypothetical protein JCM10213_008619 [Rhodosporidiobolus nylandii]
MAAFEPDETTNPPNTPLPTPSPLAAHLARFRYASPSPSRSPVRRSPRQRVPSQPALSAVASEAELAGPLPATPPKAVRVFKREQATPPRSDGSSRHFKLKRPVDEEGGAEGKDEKDEEEEEGTPKKKRKRPARPYADPSVYAHLPSDPLEDYMLPDAKLFLCGINPGKLSAEKGLHYANPTNHYWRCLAGSGLTDRLLRPDEGPLLATQYSICATNLVTRPTAEMSEVSNDEMKASVPALLAKLVKYCPRCIGFVGMKICEVVLRYLHNLPRPVPPGASPSKRRPAMPKVKIGLQPVTLSLPPQEGETERRKVYVWCLPSTSARVVEYQLVDKVKIFTQLKSDIDKLCASPPVELELPAGTVDYPAETLFPPEPEAEKAVKVEEEASTPWKITMIGLEDVQRESVVKKEEEPE